MQAKMQIALAFLAMVGAAHGRRPPRHSEPVLRGGHSNHALLQPRGAHHLVVLQQGW